MNGLSVAADGLASRTREGPIFGALTLDVGPGQLVAMCGPAGSGRSALLLTLCARMKIRSGTLQVGERELPRASRWVRKNSTVAPSGGVLGLEGGLRVHEEVERARWLAGRRRLRPGFEDAAAFAGLADRRKTLVRDLSAIDRNRLAIASGLVENTGLLIVDDLGAGVAAAEHTELWTLLRSAIDSTGVTVIASSLEHDPPRGIADQIIEMPHSPTADDDAGVVRV